MSVNGEEKAAAGEETAKPVEETPPPALEEKKPEEKKEEAKVDKKEVTTEKKEENGDEKKPEENGSDKKSGGFKDRYVFNKFKMFQHFRKHQFKRAARVYFHATNVKPVPTSALDTTTIISNKSSKRYLLKKKNFKFNLSASTIFN